MNAAIVVLDAKPATAADGVAWWRTARARRFFKLVLLAVATLLALFYRRPDQFLHPAVWVEDGTVNILDYFVSGWGSLFNPIAGYISLPIKFLHALAQTLSFRWLPEIGFWLTVLFTYGVLAVIATAPTTLRLPFVCAAATLAIPCDSEVFAVSLYTGWWGSLLALLPLFWRDGGRPRTALRLGLIVLGGLSSPLIVVLSPLYALRAAIRRTRVEYVSVAVCAAVVIVQILALRKRGSPGQGEMSFALATTVEKFFGYFVVEPSTPGLSGAIVYVGFALLAFLVAAGLRHRRELGLTYVLVAAALAAAVAATLVRVPVEAIHPKLAGPRYFFYPFVLLAWALIQIAALEKNVVRIGATIVLALAGRNALEVAQRRHDAIDWRANVEQCLHEDAHLMQIHYIGSSAGLWQVRLTNAQCRRLVGQSWFDNAVTR